MHLRPDNLVDEYKKLLKIADLPDIRFHDLRYRVATDPHGEERKSASFLLLQTSAVVVDEEM